MLRQEDDVVVENVLAEDLPAGREKQRAALRFWVDEVEANGDGECGGGGNEWR
jgi:hypothetical protein